MAFAEDLKRACDATKGRAEDVVRRSAIAMQKSMILKTPVDSGRMRANFQCGLGDINRRNGYLPGSDALSRTAEALLNWKPGQDIYLTNSVPYAKVVEFGLYGKPPGSANGPKTVGGYSKQAPAGFARLTAQDFSNLLHGAIQGLRT
ncbi:MAG: HK97 gp10 family phage protein [Tessaracoccus sp.]|uniref:HK97 gp10 family phage protein n=1 Tax=Tessaracoccus sp. TaxID=1971211 RepID=UPI001EB1AFCA|nr:HK97 gp10 family phage protein [Tessaracoccus sp.]MBK7822931.1 HK97 gp10 family phage protein [Tessaracoccus sp.]